MIFPIDYYVENYSPPSNKVAFTWKNDTDQSTIDVDPLYLAAISSVYRTIPHCDTFEINQRNTITSDDAALCFFTMLPQIDGWSEAGRPDPLDDDALADAWTDDEDNRDWPINVLYQAAELCNFLGIKASDYGIKTSITAKTIVPYHQMFLKTHCKVGITICEERFRRTYSSLPLIGADWEFNKKRTHHYNENYRCIIQAYIDFAKKTKTLDVKIKSFMKEKLGWNDEDERFGVKISLWD
jgi:hypothetical protein